MDYEEIKKLIDDMGNAKIDELEIEFPEGMKISMKKNTEKIRAPSAKTMHCGRHGASSEQHL